ncbi:MAG: carboxypeptidase-like regulatory domain-containing protein [Sandaracinaceae bacterium]|nr:carboxypeptidase-like regulatory domain-containing protein [Sandaracinaceae bacterium]
MRTCCTLLALLILGATAPSAVRADHTVHVRAETRIELDVQRDARLAIRGVLRDDAGAVLGDRRVRVTVRAADGATLELPTTTSIEGVFQLDTPAPPGTSVVTASFAGELDLEPSTVRAVVDERLAHVVLLLEIEGGPRLSLDRPTHTLRVRAQSGAGGAGLAIRLHNEVGTEIATGTSGEDGSLLLELPSRLLGPPASGRLIARSEADPRRAAAQTELPIVRYRETSLAWADAETELTESTTLRARLTSTAGPLERRAIGFFVGDVHVATRLTDNEGSAAVPVPLAFARGGEEVVVQARFDSDAPWLADSESPPRTLHVRTARRWTPYLAAASALVFGSLLWWLRRRPIRGDVEQRASRVPGVALAAPIVARASLRAVSGTVLHASTAEPIGDATVRCAGSQTVTTGAGRFSLDLAEGLHPLEVEAAGYEPQRQRISIPHRGEWTGVVIRLESRRDVAGRLLLEILALVLPGEVATTATDRELLAMARKRGAGWPDLEELVQAVEEIVYGDAPPDASALRRVRDLSQRVRTKLTRVDSASAASL